MVHERHFHVGYVVMFFLALLLYSGCAGGGVSESSYRSGSQGIELRWAQGNQYDFFEGEPVSLLLDVRNRGSHPVQQQDMKLFLTGGFDRTYLPLEINQVPGTLEGRTRFDPRGDFGELITIGMNQPARLPVHRKEFAQSVHVTACYRYKTQTFASACVDPDPFNRRLASKACQLNVRGYGAQGHPVVVNRIDPVVAGNDIRYTIYFSNQGRGTVYSPSLSLDACGLNTYEQRSTNVVTATAMLGSRSLRCEPTGLVRLINNQGMLVCTCQNCLEDNAFETTLTVELSYIYGSSISTNIRLYSD
ncbi:MAG: hypothetical protein ACMXYF_00580 [Candidatus Woesearchaeota archaeon]